MKTLRPVAASSPIPFAFGSRMVALTPVKHCPMVPILWRPPVYDEISYAYNAFCQALFLL